MTEKHTQNVDPLHNVPSEPDPAVAWGAMRSDLEGDPNKLGSAAGEVQKKVYRHLSPPNIGHGHHDDWKFGPDTVSSLPGRVSQEPGRQAEINNLEASYAIPARKPEDRNPNGTTDKRTSPEVSGPSDAAREAVLGRSTVKDRTIPGRYRKQRGRNRAS